MTDEPTSRGVDPPSPDPVRAFAETFADVFQNDVCLAVRAGKPFDARAWVLTRRNPFTRALYTDDRYGLVVYTPAAITSAEGLYEAVSRLRIFAKQSTAIGIALAFPVFYEAPAASEPTTGAHNDALLIVEHRALPRPRRRIVLGPAPGEDRALVTFLNLDENVPAELADTLESWQSLLPALD